MKTKGIDRYFKTDNEHWNEHALKTIKKALEKQIFTDFNELMILYKESIKVASVTHKDKPFEALQIILSEYVQSKLNNEQSLYLMEAVCNYLDRTDFDGWYSNEIQGLMQSQIIVYKHELETKLPEYNEPLTRNIRDTLKDLMQQELEKLPTRLNDLDPVQRLSVLCKLMPYALPKTESVKHNLGEPDEFKIKVFHK